MNPPRMRSGFVDTESDLRVFWQATGDGPALVCCNGVGVSTFFWKYVVEKFSDRFTVVTWDYRGHGRSDRPRDPDACDLSVRASAQDLGRILDALEIQEAVYMGHSMGCQVILERYRQAPESVRGLVLMLGSAGNVLDTFYDNPHSPKVFDLIFDTVESIGGRINKITGALLRTPLAWKVTRRLKLVDPLYTSEEDFLPYLTHMARLDMRLFLRMVREAQQHNAFPLLPHVQVPALVVAAEKDTFTPMWLSEKMTSELPDAELIVLADGSHAAIIEQPRTINHRLERFLREKVTWRGAPGIRRAS
ncbi:MAG: alpha/beta hydrolase [Alphaproteobacteria bacterium]|nr:alpha/beta hydrolase [Alphaproteobacteria bacterium]MCB9791637.1 alpha/beta hydrolase [Alphaproteobacteria bacterium]